MKKSESTSNIFAALAKAQAQVTHARLDSKNPHFKNEYASLESCIDVIRPILSANDLSLVQCLDKSVEGDNVLVSLVTHSSGEFIQFDSGILLSKNDMQGIGSAISYQRRYSLQAIFNMGDKDDDGQAACKPTNNPKSVPNREQQGKAGNYVIPFGRSEGKKVSDLSDDDLRILIDWCQGKTGAAATLREEALAYLESRK